MERSLRFDLLIAVCALLISAVAAGASVYQTHVIASQYSASVWPYVTVTGSGSSTGFKLAIENDGLGPALIRSAQLRFAGRPLASWRELVSEAPLKAAASKSELLNASSVDASTVVRAGETLPIFSLSSAGFAAHQPAVANAASRVDVRLCYCSILGRCWTVESLLRSNVPRDVKGCPRGQSIMTGYSS